MYVKNGVKGKNTSLLVFASPKKITKNFFFSNSSVSVKCAACQKSYHMSCLNPPLIRKPSKGFAWQCAFCTRQEALSLSAAAAAATQAKEKSSESKPKQSTEQKSTKSNSKRSVRSTRSQVTTTTTPTEKSTTSSPPITILIPSPLSETSIKLKINQKKNGSPKSKLFYTFYHCFFIHSFTRRSTQNDTHVAISIFRCQYRNQ